jgi:hypothetical protein
MPDETVPTPKVTKRNERTEAKFFEDAAKLIAEAVREGAAYLPPTEIARVDKLQLKYDAALFQRTSNQATVSAEEVLRNYRENLYKSLRSNVRSLVEYAKSAGVAKNDIDALNSIARLISGGRAKPVAGGASSNSVSHRSFVTLLDNYMAFIEQYDALGIATTEDMYKADTHRAKAAAMQQANADIIDAEAASNTSGELLDKLAYTDDDSLLKSCVASKGYIKSKYKGVGEPYKNIAKTRFEMPSRLR